MPESEVNINFRGTPQYRERLARAALDRKIKVQALLERAIESYLSRANDSNTEKPLHTEKISTGNDISADTRPSVHDSDTLTTRKKLHGQLDAILDSGHAVVMSAIAQNLEAFCLITGRVAGGDIVGNAGAGDTDLRPAVKDALRGAEDIIRDAGEAERRHEENRKTGRTGSKRTG